MRIGTTGTSVVLDASAVVRALVDGDAEALDWFDRIARDEVRAACPELLYVEVANAVLQLQRGGRLTESTARGVIDATLAAPLEPEPIHGLVSAAWSVASERGLTVYDALYVVLAEASDASLLTADRRLGAATENALLLTG